MLREQADALEDGSAMLMAVSSSGASESGGRTIKLLVDVDPWGEPRVFEVYSVRSDGNGADVVKFGDDLSDYRYRSTAPRNAFKVGDRLLVKTRRLE